MYDSKLASASEGLRLYDLLIRFQQGDKSCYEKIIKRFSWLLSKASYNSNIGGPDDDLRSEIHLALFLKLQQFIIPGSDILNPTLAAREDDLFELQSVPM